MRDAVIVEAVRTPVGKRNGGLSGVHPADLSAHVLNSLVQRAGVDPDYLDRLVELGILTPAAGEAFSPGDALRARWL